MISSALHPPFDDLRAAVPRRHLAVAVERDDRVVLHALDHEAEPLLGRALLRLGDPALPAHGQDHHDEDDRADHEQPERHAPAMERDALADPVEPQLFLLQLTDDRAQRVHVGLRAAHRRRELRAAAAVLVERSHLAQGIEARLRELLEPHHSLLLLRVVRGERANARELVSPTRLRRFVRTEKLRVSRDDVAAHARLGVDHRREERREREPHLIRVRHPIVRARELPQRIDRAAEQRDEDREQRCQQPPADRASSGDVGFAHPCRDGFEQTVRRLRRRSQVTIDARSENMAGAKVDLFFSDVNGGAACSLA